MSESESMTDEHIHVLMIEDEPGITYALKLRLELEGYEVDNAADGTTGLRMVKEVNPNVILLDIRLPDISGIDVCKRIKADPVTENIPVIFMSANVQAVARELADQVGGIAYLPKPFEPYQMVEAIKEAVAGGDEQASECA